MRQLLTPPLTTDSQTREYILDYFHNSYATYEAMFDLFVDDSALYLKSEPTRHSMIFYLAHTAVFFINKLIASKIISERIDSHFEHLFAVGVDEMSWDNIQSDRYASIKIKEVYDYRSRVKDLVSSLIQTLPLPSHIDQSSKWWAILMSIEHERIHIETSSVLHRQMPLKYIRSNTLFEPCSDRDFRDIVNEFVMIDGGSVLLAKHHSSDLYGWDNEYGECEVEVDQFETTKYLITYAEFLEFVKDGGYSNHEYWSSEGREYLLASRAIMPPFVTMANGVYRLRLIDRVVDLPLTWPAEVNYLEAEAYCNYLSQRDDAEYSLPTEAQWHRMLDQSGAVEKDIFDDSRANLNLAHYLSASPVDTFRHGKLYDVVGNVWQWSSTLFDRFDKFEPHYLYDDFSVPTFDQKHNLIKGGSFISSGNEITRYSRYAFRRHFHQHAGFRMIKGGSIKTEQQNSFYESDLSIAQYCEFHYGNSYFGVENFAQKCARLAIDFSSHTPQKSALDIGCAVGRCSFELARVFESVDGLDFSTRFIQIGVKLQSLGELEYALVQEGDIVDKQSIRLDELDLQESADRVKFAQADACNMDSKYNSYDLIIATNLIDRLYQPATFLRDLAGRINPDGILVITSPYSWSEEFTTKVNWLGGYIDEDANSIFTLDSITSLLSVDFDLLHTQDIEFVIQESARKYQHTISQMSVWRKKAV